MTIRILTLAAALSYGGLTTTFAQQAKVAMTTKTKSQLQQDFLRKKQAFPKGSFFRIFDTSLSSEERDALTFLYAYMPSNDLIDRDGNYFLENVRSSLEARKTMPWGKVVPEREWRHFVLPIRVNNEALDGSRPYLFNALKDRVKGLTLEQAVLEVNHWCHEHVVYTPSDSRTSSPLATLRTAYGRCGEESTLLVAALRSVGIPARQVYTPRWAHTDDNHAWVEAWVDGKWLFLGACEPEPVLNLAWFNAPVSRAMLVHTKAFGRYDGPEEVISRTPTYTEINVIDNYAHTGKVDVQVVDAAGRPQAGVPVEFQVYNYGQFYTVATKLTDSRGRAFLTAGQGDMLIYANKPDGKGSYRFGFQKAHFGQDKQVRLQLNHRPGDQINEDLLITPPREDAKYPNVTDSQRAENNRRMATEDSIRGQYVATFIGKQLEGMDARGNWKTLHEFVEGAKDKAQAKALLRAISSKDLRDIPLDVLRDHLENTHPLAQFAGNKELSMNYIYNPRVANEPLVAYKKFFAEAVPQALQSKFRSSFEALRQWCVSTIHIDNSHNPLTYPIEPIGVWKSQKADTHSRNIFFVSLARTMGWPTRIDGVTGKVQVYEQDAWHDVVLDKGLSQKPSKQGTLRLSYKDNGIIDNPKYYYQFTISKFDAQGSPQLLSYDEGDNGLEQGTSWAMTFKDGAKMDAGNYLLVTGSRLASGSVLVNMRTFTIKPEQTTSEELVMRRDTTAVAVLGSFNSENLYTYYGDAKDLTKVEHFTAPTGKEQSLLSTTGRGYYILGILGAGEEPTNHALKDIIAEREVFEHWGRSLVLLFKDKTSQSRYRPDDFVGLPKGTVFGLDTQGKILSELVTNMKLRAGNLPVFVIADTFNRVVFVSQGYTIGLGRQLRQVITALEKEQCTTPTKTCTIP